MSKVRTRFAPSPTGRMHVGNLRSALYEFLIAKHEGGDFMLRIEDTDQERFVDGALDIIYRTLAKTGLVHDEGPDKDGGYGPYVQSERMKTGIYMKYAKELVEKGEAYYCFCDKERLESLKTEVDGKEIMMYDKHCLHLSKEEVEANLAAGNRLRNGGHGLRLRLGRHRVGVGLERFVDLAKRRIEVIHLDKVRLFPLGQAVIGCFFHRVLPFHHARRTTLSTPMASSMLEKR